MIIPVSVDAVVGGFAIVTPLAGHDLAINDQVIVSGPASPDETAPISGPILQLDGVQRTYPGRPEVVALQR